MVTLIKIIGEDCTHRQLILFHHHFHHKDDDDADDDDDDDGDGDDDEPLHPKRWPLTTTCEPMVCQVL